MLFDAWIDIGEGADSAGNGAGGDFFAGIDEARAAAVELGIGFGHFQAEGHRLGVNAVRAADADRILVFDCAALDSGEKRVHVGKEQIGGLDQLHVEAGVEHIRRGHALVNETGVGTNDLGQVGEECDDVVLGFALDLVDAVDVEGGRAALVPDGLGSFPGDHAEIGQRIAGMGLDLEPDAEF